MKAPKSLESIALTRKTLRAIERDLGIYLDRPVEGKRTFCQQFGVYDEDEVHVADITAEGHHFTEVELRQRIQEAFDQ